MKNLNYRLATTLSLLLITVITYAQDQPIRRDKFYSMSGFGLSVPVGGSRDFMRPKFSTTIGANIGLGDGGLFLYPKLSLHAFSYDTRQTSDEFNSQLEKGRATTYLLNVALGYRKIVDKFAFYGFVGGGGGFILSPRLSVNQSTNTALLNNKSNPMGMIEPGAGMEYSLGGVNLFLESSFMYGLGKVGGQSFRSVPITFGIKPNLSRAFRRNK